MSRMMQPRDQMSDLLEKEKLRASGAIQDFWQGSAGRIKVEEPLSAMFPEDKRQDRASLIPSITTPFGCFERGSPVSQMCLHLPVLRLQPCPTGLATLSWFQWSLARASDSSPSVTLFERDEKCKLRQ